MNTQTQPKLLISNDLQLKSNSNIFSQVIFILALVEELKHQLGLEDVVNDGKVIFVGYEIVIQIAEYQIMHQEFGSTYFVKVQVTL
jgi:hypothetical protein